MKLQIEQAFGKYYATVELASNRPRIAAAIMRNFELPQLSAECTAFRDVPDNLSISICIGTKEPELALVHQIIGCYQAWLDYMVTEYNRLDSWLKCRAEVEA